MARDTTFDDTLDALIAVVFEAHALIVEHDIDELIEQIDRESSTAWFMMAPHAYLESEQATQGLKRAAKAAKALAALFEDEGFSKAALRRQLLKSQELLEGSK